MDVLAHGLWTNIMYKAIPATSNNRKTTWWGIFFGVLPDFVSFTPIFALFFIHLISGQVSAPTGRPELETFPLAELTQQLYNYTHSLVVFLVVFGVIWLVSRKLPWILLGWGLHVGIDIFTHSREFYPTPFLYPVSEFNVNGVPWAHPIFMAINYGLLLLIYLLLIPTIKKLFISNNKPPQV